MGEPSNNKTFKPFPTALLNVDSEQFKAHLGSRSSDISSAISKLFARAQSPASEVPEIKARLAQLLAAEKAHITELEKNRQEKTKLEERLEDAAFRYMIAEKKLDRSKSATVAKLEKQAICGGRSESGSGLGGNREESGNQKDLPTTNSEDFAAVDLARREAEVESQKRKEQLETLGAENHKLTTQLTTLNIQLSTLTDEEYSKTDLFKQVRSQLEDSIRRVNDLEATNIQLREEAERLHAERTSYKVHVEHESATAIGERERMLSQAEVDLARIRTNRDDLNADIAMRKAALSQDRTSVEQVKELASAKDHRIYTLESEVARLQSNHGQDAGPATPPQSLDGLSPVEIQSRYATLEKQHGLLNNELESMQVAFSKANKLASQKVNAQSSLEEKVQRLSAEKSKADQKYFAAMKAKEAREQEVRTLRAQNAKSSEMVTSLKDAETANRALQVVSDKQNAEAKESILNISAKLKLEQQALTERILQIDGLKSQLEELKKNLTAKDEHVTSTSTTCRQAEVEVESLKVKLEETEKSRESWKAKGLGNQSSEYEMLRVCLLTFNERMSLTIDSISQSVPCVAPTSRTQLSRHAVMYSAKTASMSGRLHGLENARIATDPSALATS